MSDGAIRHASPHPPAPEDKHKCGGCRLQAEVDRLRRIEAAARVVDEWNRKRQPFNPAEPFRALAAALAPSAEPPETERR